MPEIEIDFKSFLPSPSVFYSYFVIMKHHEFIRDIEVIQSDKTAAPILRIHRNDSHILPTFTS